MMTPPAAIEVEAVIAREVVDRMPVDTATVFPADVGKLWCWSRVKGAAGTTIHHVWIHNGEEVADVELDVGGPSWRTYSSKEIPADATGEWKVEIRDLAGTVVKSLAFTVGGPGATPIP